MKKLVIALIIIVAIALLWVGYNAWRGIKPAVTPPPYDIAEVIEDAATSSREVSEEPSEQAELPPAKNMTEFPLSLPDGFTIEIFAKDLSGARVIAMGPVDEFTTNMLVSRPGEGKVTVLEMRDGEVGYRWDLFGWEEWNRPHGVVYGGKPYRGAIYIAEEHRIVRILWDSDAPREAIATLPKGGRHFTRFIGFGPDDELYVSIGSTCDVCVEEDERNATIMRVNLETGELEPFAKGLRNSVFFTFHPETGKMWATEMGRDHLGDDLPPDEINIVESDPSTPLGARNYGWPNCYGKNVHDADFDKNVYVRNSCMEPFETPSHIDLPAHVAPLGLAFIPSNSTWPKEYWGDLLVAYHGSWNRSVPVGYKVVRLDLDENGNFIAEHDFISGWLTDDNRALGRPVGLLIDKDGILYVSDDKAGVVYKVVYRAGGL